MKKSAQTYRNYRERHTVSSRATASYCDVTSTSQVVILLEGLREVHPLPSSPGPRVVSRCRLSNAITRTAVKYFIFSEILILTLCFSRKEMVHRVKEVCRKRLFLKFSVVMNVQYNAFSSGTNIVFVLR